MKSHRDLGDLLELLQDIVRMRFCSGDLGNNERFESVRTKAAGTPNIMWSASPTPTKSPQAARQYREQVEI